MPGRSGSRVVLEEFLEGDELSFWWSATASVSPRWSPRRIISELATATLARTPAAWAPTTTRDIVDDQMREWLLAHIARPVVAGMKAEGAEYKGVLYCGLMMTRADPWCSNSTARFGDPETQPILMRLESDLVEAMEASIDGRTSDGDFKWSNDARCVW